VASRGRLTARLARPAAQAAVPLMAATERLGELARDQERAVRSALLDEALDLAPGSRRELRGLAARAASFGLDFSEPARVLAIEPAQIDALERSAAEAGTPHLVTARGARTVALLQCPRAGGLGIVAALDGVRAGIGRPIEHIGDVPRSYRDAELAVERVRDGALAYEDFDLATLVLSEVAPEHIRPRVDELLAPFRASPPLLEAILEYFAHDMDVKAAADDMHVHPNTLRYRLSRVEKLLGRSLRSPATIAELSLALLAAQASDARGGEPAHDQQQRA
jgi:purine catabolism regulator